MITPRGFVGAALAALVAAGALSAPPASAAREIVLTGSRSGWVDVRIGGSLQPQPPVVETRGRFAGFYAVQRTSDVDRPGTEGGWVAVRGLGPGDSLDPMQLGRVPDVGPGVVRFYLIADGPTTVRIDADNIGIGAGTYRVKPVTVRAQLRTAPLVQKGDVWTATTSSMPVEPGAVNLAAVRAGGELSVLSDAAVCLRRVKDEPCEPMPPASGTALGNGTVLDPDRRWESTTRREGSRYGHLVGSATVDPPRTLTGGMLAAFSLWFPR